MAASRRLLFTGAAPVPVKAKRGLKAALEFAEEEPLGAEERDDMDGVWSFTAWVAKQEATIKKVQGREYFYSAFRFCVCVCVCFCNLIEK